MSPEENPTDDSVNGLSYTDRMKEIARENDISLDEKPSDAPEGEAASKVEEREVQPDSETDKPGDASEEADTEEFEDPFGLDKDLDIDPESSEPKEPSELEDKTEYPKGFQKKLKRNKRTISRLEQELKEAREALETQKPAETQQAPAALLTRDNFASDAEYDNYTNANDTSKLVDERVATHMKNLKDQEASRKQMEVLKSSWETKVNDNFSEAEREDYQEAIGTLGNPADVFDSKVTQYMFDNPAGPRMLKYFADNPEAIQKLKDMHEYDRGAVLSKLAIAVSKTKEVPAKQVSNATPLGGLGQKRAGTNVKPIDSMSDSEKLALYRAGKWKYD